MKRLLIITPIFPPESGGPATYVWSLLPRLARYASVTVICYSAAPSLPKSARIISINPHQPFILRQLRLGWSIFYHALSTDTLYAQGPLVVGLMSTLIGRLLGKRVVLKYVGDEVWEAERLYHRTTQNLEDFLASSHSLPLHLLLSLERISLRSAHTVITPSAYLHSVLSKHHSVPPSKLHVISNAITIRSTHPQKHPHQLIFVGRLVPWKHIDQIIKAVHLARSPANPWQLTIIGSGPEHHRLQSLSTKLSADWLTLKGNLTPAQTRKHIASAHKLILYSSYEGQPHTLIEAMLLRTPIIASNIQANLDATAGHAQFVPLNHPRLLARAINQPAYPVAAAHSHAHSHYSWSNHVQSLSNLLWP